MRTVTIVGVGRLGGALALALDRAGYTIDALIYRGTPPPPQLTRLLHHLPQISQLDSVAQIRSEIIFITTQDNAIGTAASRLEKVISGSPAVFITSGAFSSSVIGNLKNVGCSIGSVHPLISVSDPILGADRFKGSYFCLEGEQEALETAEGVVKALKGKSFSIPADKKPLYHAAAVTSSGHLVALIDMAVGMLKKCGLARDDAKKILLPLIESTLENVKQQSLEGSLTGTYARGDSETFSRHLDSLQENVSRDELEIFLALASRSIEIARHVNNKDRSLKELQERVLMAKRAWR